MNSNPSVVILTEPDRNLLTLRYSGHVTLADFRAFEDGVGTLLGSLKPGFTILADMSRLELMDVECAPFISRVMDVSRQHGVGKVVRVMPDHTKDIGINILSIIHYRGKVPIATVATLEEAERELH